MRNHFFSMLFLLLGLSFIALEVEARQQKHFTIMGIGDSITEGGDAFESYICPLWELLYGAGYDFDMIGPRRSYTRIGWINHYGNSGKNAEWVADGVEKIYPEYPADIVLIHSGHNHFMEEKPVDGIINAYRKMLAAIRSVNPDAYVLLAKVIPSGKLPKYKYIDKLNKRIGQFVKEQNDSRLICVDQSAGFDWRQNTIADKVHPNRQGAKRMAETWYEALKKILGEAPNTYNIYKTAYRKLSETDSLSLHVFRQKADIPRPAILYFFAGGWKHGSPLQFYRECDYYSKKGMVAITADYRTTKSHGTAVDDGFSDAQAALDYVRSHAIELGIDTTRIVVAGASAGGAMAGSVKGANYRVLYYPVVDSIRTAGGDVPTLMLMGSEDPYSDCGKAFSFCRNHHFDFMLVEGGRHPLFSYRQQPGKMFVRVKELTDNFLRYHGILR